MTVGGRTTLSDLARRLAWLAFAALIVLSPFRAVVAEWERPIPQIATSYTRFGLGWPDVALLATLALWVVSLALRPRAVAVGPSALSVPVAGLLVVAWLGVPSSVDPSLAAYNAVKLVLVVALGVYVLNELDRIDRLAVPIVIMVAIQAVVVLGQTVGQGSVGLSILGEQRLDPARTGISVVAAVDGTRLLRAYGLSPHPNILGGILAFALLTLIAALGRTRRERIVRSIVFALGVVALLLTFSRAAWVGFAVGAVVGVAMLAAMRDRAAIRRWAGVTIAGIVLCIPFVLAFAPYLAARANMSGPVATEVRSLDERLALAAASADVFVDRPLLGSGLGTLPTALFLDDPTFGWAYQPAHVVALVAAAETGILGLLCYLVIVIAPWVLLVRDRARWTPWLAGASAALAAVTTVGLFDYYTWTPSGGRIWAWIALGAWVAAYRAAMQGRRDA